MAATAFVRARVDETLKEEAAAVLADMGLMGKLKVLLGLLIEGDPVG